MFEVRTDLAVEENERITKAQEEAKGITVTEEDFEEEQIHITTVRITTENGAKQMGKPKGTYITLEAAEMIEDDEDYHREISKRLAEILKELIPVEDSGKRGVQRGVGSQSREDSENIERKSSTHFAEVNQNIDKKEEIGTSILVAGLGNRLVTPDALGPQVADNLYITRHIIKEFGRRAYENEQVQPISAIVPGVMAQTGMESQEIIAGIIHEVQPDYLIVVDALAARSVRRLGRTIQITDTGIYPCSGVVNHRYSITKETTGIPVIAIGIPTVVEAATIVYDSMSTLIDELAHAESLQPLKRSWGKLTEAEHRNLIRELLSPQLNHMFVTPKDIDAEIKRMSYTISEAINQAFCG